MLTWVCRPSTLLAGASSSTRPFLVQPSHQVGSPQCRGLLRYLPTWVATELRFCDSRRAFSPSPLERASLIRCLKAKTIGVQDFCVGVFLPFAFPFQAGTSEQPTFLSFSGRWTKTIQTHSSRGPASISAASGSASICIERGNEVFVLHVKFWRKNPIIESEGHFLCLEAWLKNSEVFKWLEGKHVKVIRPRPRVATAGKRRPLFHPKWSCFHKNLCVLWKFSLPWCLTRRTASFSSSCSLKEMQGDSAKARPRRCLQAAAWFVAESSMCQKDFCVARQKNKKGDRGV